MRDTSVGEHGSGAGERDGKATGTDTQSGENMCDAFGRRPFLRATAGGMLGGTTLGAVPAAVAQDAGTVVGTVTDLAGDPIEGAAVTLLDGDTEEATTQTDETGQYGVAAPPGNYELTVEKSGFEPVSEAVTIEEEGQQVTVDVTLEPPAPGAVIGIVVDESGNGVAGAEVVLLDGDSVVGTDETDIEGDYSVTADPGDYELAVSKPGFEPVSETVTVESGEATVHNLSLPSGPPALPGTEGPPQDLDSDGQFEDVDGDGELSIFDVQALFTNLDSPLVQNNPVAFNFDGDPDPEAVTILDVQALFERLSEQG